MSVIMVLLNVLSYIFLNVGINDQWYYLIPAVLTLFGLWGVFRKCGLTPWHVLIPYVRNVRLSVKPQAWKRKAVSWASFPSSHLS